jgi:hypothetical protein
MLRTVAALTVAAFILVPVPAGAAQPTILHSALGCISTGRNARITAKIDGSPKSARVYFHSTGAPCGDYYVDMHQGSAPSQFWAVLPIIEKDVTSITYQIRVTDVLGHETVAPPVTVTPSPECRIDPLTAEQSRAAKNLTIGLTSKDQRAVPCSFKCDGIKALITVDNVLRPHDECRLLLAGLAKPWYATKAGAATAAGAVGAGALIYNGTRNTKAPSPARP